GVTGQGIYLQIDQYLIDGFISLQELPGDKSDRWQLNRNTGALVAQRSGRVITIGDRFPAARIASVDLARRQLELVIIEERHSRRLKQGKVKAQAPAKTKPPRSTKKSRGKASQATPQTPSSARDRGKSKRSFTKKKKAHAQTIKLKKHRGRKRK
ncbi:MAG: hypothetical protein AAGJ38_08460, partial [Planctomycetota bacterium]